MTPMTDDELAEEIRKQLLASAAGVMASAAGVMTLLNRAHGWRTQRDDLLKALRAVVENFGPWHDDECPGDATCACSAKPVHDIVNAAIQKAEGR